MSRSSLWFASLAALVAIAVFGSSPAQAAFPGRNGRIAFGDSHDGVSSVWPSGSGIRRLVRRGDEPVYSPSGDRLVFQRMFELETDHPLITHFDLTRVEVVAASGGNRRVLTKGNDATPHWAPDGKRIVFYREPPCWKYSSGEAECPARVKRIRKHGILVRTPRGHTRVVTRAGNSPVVWSPDGKWIAYENRGRLVAVRPDGSNARVISARAPTQGIDWSPDSNRIVFAHLRRTSHDFEIASIRADGTGFQTLVRNGDSPSYSPDGRWVVFERDENRLCNYGTSLWLVPAWGGRPRLLRAGSGRRICGNSPDWQPLP